MRFTLHRILLTAIPITLALALSACSRSQRTVAVADPHVLTAARDAFVAAGPAAAIAILPARLLDHPEPNVGDALGLLLERNGLTNLEPARSAFKPRAESTWEDLPEQFGEFVRSESIGVKYSFYMEILGSHATGIDELRWLVADSRGEIALADRLTRGDAEWKRLLGQKPEPMTCCTAVTERLFALTGWTKRAAPASAQGTFARLWADKTGIPTAAEFDAMKQRLATLKREIKSAKIVVLPTHLGAIDDAASGARIAASLKISLSCQSTAIDGVAHFDIKPSINEQKVLWDLARAVRDYVRTAALDADYVVIGDIIGDMDHNVVAGVHVVVCAKSGDWVIVDYQNSHFDAFSRAAPASVGDCEKLMIARLTELLK